MSNEHEETWLTATDAGEVLKLSPRQVHRYGEIGKLTTRRAGRRVLYAASTVAALADELQVNVRPPAPERREMVTASDLSELGRAMDERQRRIEDTLQRIEERLVAQQQPAPARVPWLMIIVLIVVIVGVAIGLVVLARLL